MAFIVDKMLEDISRQGFSPEELKKEVIYILTPYFDDKVTLNKNAMQSHFLSLFSYLVMYHSDATFSQQLMDVITCYRNAYSRNPSKVKEVIFSTINFIGQKENLMWTVKSNTPNILTGDIHEITYTYMKHIGDVLEIATRHEITELYAILEISLDKIIDYESIMKRDFGVIVQSIIDKNFFENILITFPNNIKLSDWRNIAYHHTYEISQDKIKCFYGKKGNNFEVTLEELFRYAVNIIKSSNVIDMARKIFLFDNNDIFSDLNEDSIKVHDRVVMKIGQLRTAFLGQGFKLISEILDGDYEEIILEDLELSNVCSNDFRLKRQIHCTQFLLNLWTEFPSKLVSIIHSDNSGKKLYKYSIDGQICKNIAEETLNYNDMIKFVKIEKL